MNHVGGWQGVIALERQFNDNSLNHNFPVHVEHQLPICMSNTNDLLSKAASCPFRTTIILCTFEHQWTLSDACKKNNLHIILEYHTGTSPSNKGSGN